MSLVLLGCRVLGPATLSPPAARRAERALEAYRAGLSDHILACGGKEWSGVREADALVAYLTQAGVHAAALERETWSRYTRENARYAARLLLPRGLYRIGVVTCDWHMPRALACFRGVGFDAEPLPARAPATTLSRRLLRVAHERLSFSLDGFLTRGFLKP